MAIRSKSHACVCCMGGYRYLSVGIEYGQKLFEAFSPIVKDSIQARQFRSREVNLAGEERYACACVCVLSSRFRDSECVPFCFVFLCAPLVRTQRCITCDGCFQEMHHHMQVLEAHMRCPSSLQNKVRVFARTLSDFYSR